MSIDGSTLDVADNNGQAVDSASEPRNLCLAEVLQVFIVKDLDVFIQDSLSNVRANLLVEDQIEEPGVGSIWTDDRRDDDGCVGTTRII